MKNKDFVVISAVASAIALVLRGAEYLLFIDEGGYYIGAKPLAYPLYAILILISAFAFVIMLSKTKSQAESVTAGGTTIGICCIAAAIFTAAFSGWAALSLSSEVPVMLHRALVLSGILTAIYLAAHGVGSISGKQPFVLRLCGFLPAVFFCIYGVCEFYQSFDRAQQSGTSYLMLSLCALALFTISLFYCSVGAPVSLKRLTATAFLFPPFACVWGGGYLIGCVTGGADFSIGHLLFALIHFAFVACAFAAIFRLDKKVYAQKHEAVLDSELDTYINDIPTEETDE